MTCPDWLTVPAAPVAVWYRAGDEAVKLKRTGQLGVLAHPLLAERYRQAARGDVECWMSVVRGEIIDPSCCMPFVPLDRHRLDVALSMGRHAVERATLAGCQVLLCRGMTDDSGHDIWPPLAAASRHAAYARLHQRARFEIAVLSGALVAGAQMGLQMFSSGLQARRASEIALALNPGVGNWLSDSRRTMRQPLRITSARIGITEAG